MAKIRLDNLLNEVKGKSTGKLAQESALTINKLKAGDDSVINQTRQKLSLEEATRLGREISKRFSEDPASVDAQGSGLTEDRVAALLADD